MRVVLCSKNSLGRDIVAINDPRKIDYDFKLLLYDEWVFLFDDSERSFLCSSIASVYLVPVFKAGTSPWETDTLYVEQPEICYTDPLYMRACDLHHYPKVDLIPVDKDEDNDHAWDEAHEAVWDTMGDIDFPKLTET